MKHKLLWILLLCYACNLHAQYDFYKIYTGNSNTSFLTAKKLNTYNENTVASGQLLTSVNKQGQINWAKEAYFDSSATQLQFLGISYNELIATPDGGFIGLANTVPLGIVSRFDSLGNEIWTKSFDRLNEGVSFTAGLRTSTNEYVLLTRPYQFSGNTLPYEWVKIDINGNVIWQQSHFVPFNGFEPTIIKENNLGYIVGGLSGTVAQMDFNGNILWIRNHDMRLKNIFPVGNNEYIIIGATVGYTNEVWSRLSYGGSPIWTKIIPSTNGLWWNGLFHDYKRYKELSDSNIIDIQPVISLTTPNIADIKIVKLNTQNGNVIWAKRHLPNMPIVSNAIVRDYAVITDSIFSLFAFTNVTLNSAHYGHYLRIDIGHHPNTTGCLTQNEPITSAMNTTIPVLNMQSQIQSKPYIIQDTSFYIIDVDLVENVVCENGVAADFVVDNHLLCINDCVTITDSSSGSITSYEWTFFGTDTTYHFTEFPPQICYPNTGTFSIQLVVSDGFLSDTMRKTIHVFDLSDVELGQDTTLCQGEFIAPIFQIPYADFSWNTGDITPYLFINNSGTYSVAITQGACYKTDTIVVNVLDIPTVDLGADTSFCDIDSLVLDATIPNGNYTYEWQDNSTNSQLMATTSGLYSVVVSDTFGCQNSDDILLSFTNFNINLGNDTMLCQGENITLDVTIPNATYLWNDNSTDSVLMVNNSGTYSVDVTINNCTTSDTIQVIVANLPIVDLGNDTTFCNEIEYNLIANASNNVSYLWNTNATTSNIFVNNSAIYSVIVTDTITNCQATDSVEMTFIQTNLFDLGNDTILCDTQTLRLNAFVSNATYLWNNGSTSSEILVNDNGLYSVDVSIGNCVASDIINVQFISPMNLNLGEDRTLCNDEIIDLDAFDANAQNYLWSNNSINSDILINQAGTYFVTVFYNQNCQVSDTIIFVEEGEIYATLPNDTIICQDNSVTLNVYQPNATSYEWQTVEAYFQQHNLQDSIIIATLPGEYKVTISNECRAFTQTITIEEEDCGCYPYVPNAFTPNNDGNNDVFEIYTNCVLSNYNLKIFDRWGGILFESDDANKGWDGTSRGQALKNGVYVWLLTYESPNEKGEMETFVKNGSLTLLR